MIQTLKPTQLPPTHGSSWYVTEGTSSGKKIFILQLLGGAGNSFNPHYEIAVTTITEFDLHVQLSAFGKKPQEVIDAMARDLIKLSYV